MGDRANIVIKERSGGYLYLYTHWQGAELPLVLQRALQRMERWNDESYLARLIFCEMIGDDVGSGLNFGISTYMTDNQYPLLVVDMEQQTVGLASEPLQQGAAPTVEFCWPFEDFIRIEFAFNPWQTLHDGNVTYSRVAIPYDMFDELFLQTAHPNRAPRRRVKKSRYATSE